jgi:predicted dehydrogenase
MSNAAQARIIRLLGRRTAERGITVNDNSSCCIRRGEIHSFFVTDEADIKPGSRIDHTEDIGFAEFMTPAVIEAGDNMYIGNRLLGKIAGFDAWNYPNHYDILIKAPSRLTADDLKHRIGDVISIAPDTTIKVDPTSSVLPSIIIGFGHAGSMHARCIEKARDRFAGCQDAAVPSYVIDPALEGDLPRSQRLEWRIIWSLSELPAEVRKKAVAHVCTPPAIRIGVIEDALAAGINRFIVEKPLASTPDVISQLAALLKSYGADLLVVANWTSSNLTREIQSFISHHESDVISIQIRQQKCRISKSKTNQGHVSAFEVEMPHMMSLAQLLAGPDLVVRQARAWDMIVEGRTIPEMGGAELTLDEPSGVVIQICSDHLAPALERSVRIEFRDGARLEGYYPCSSLDHYSQLKSYGNNGQLIAHKYIEDDTLTQFFVEAYAYFIGQGAKPRSDFEFGAGVCALLHEARRLSVRHSHAK